MINLVRDAAARGSASDPQMLPVQLPLPRVHLNEHCHPLCREKRCFLLLRSHGKPILQTPRTPWCSDFPSAVSAGFPLPAP